jgi:hypothetical protein
MAKHTKIIGGKHAGRKRGHKKGGKKGRARKH